jgi:hypothetical protein
VKLGDAWRVLLSVRVYQIPFCMRVFKGKKNENSFWVQWATFGERDFYTARSVFSALYTIAAVHSF